MTGTGADCCAIPALPNAYTTLTKNQRHKVGGSAEILRGCVIRARGQSPRNGIPPSGLFGDYEEEVVGGFGVLACGRCAEFNTGIFAAN